MKYVAKQLKQTQSRSTRQKQYVLEALTLYPQSVKEICAILKKEGVVIDTATVYRTLNRLVKSSIVNKVYLKDKAAQFELRAETDHHHHLVCDNCGSIEDISFDENSLFKIINKQTNFHIQSHILEIFGLCANCRS